MTKPTIFDPVTTYVLPSTAARYIRTTEAELARDREREQPKFLSCCSRGKSATPDGSLTPS